MHGLKPSVHVCPSIHCIQIKYQYLPSAVHACLFNVIYQMVNLKRNTSMIPLQNLSTIIRVLVYPRRLAQTTHVGYLAIL